MTQQKTVGQVADLYEFNWIYEYMCDWYWGIAQ